MKTVSFNKKCNIEVLDKALRDAGFKIDGCSSNGREIFVHLSDDEKKDPAPIVKAHKYSEPKPRDWKDEFKKCKTDKERIQMIAEYLGLE
jgi:hypothetical protein